MSKRDGGPAFPFECKWHKKDGSTLGPHPGMTLRQWYAGMALQAGLARAGNGWGDPEGVAKDAFAYADAMLAQEVGDE